MPALASRSPNADAVAPATIPRGAIHARNARSRVLRLNRQVVSATTAGRITRIITATSASAPPSTDLTSLGETDAAIITNRTAISSCTSVSWNSTAGATSIER
jgi:hypothetical protein